MQVPPVEKSDWLTDCDFVTDCWSIDFISDFPISFSPTNRLSSDWSISLSAQSATFCRENYVFGNALNSMMFCTNRIDSTIVFAHHLIYILSTRICASIHTNILLISHQYTYSCLVCDQSISWRPFCDFNASFWDYISLTGNRTKAKTVKIASS